MSGSRVKFLRSNFPSPSKSVQRKLRKQWSKTAWNVRHKVMDSITGDEKDNTTQHNIQAS